MLLNRFQDVLDSPLLGTLSLLIFLGTLLFSLMFHEFSHALVSLALGDYGQRKRGRLSFNPLRHLDPLGTLMMLFVGFGWAKPVQTDERLLKPTPEVGMAMVGLAGPLSNLLLALLAALPYRLHLYPFFGSSLNQPFGLTPAVVIGVIAFNLVLWNIALAVFNLIPIPPLDGSWALRLLLPPRLRRGPAYARIAQYGMFLFILLIGIQYFNGPPILGYLISEPIRFLSRLILGRAIA